MSSQLDDIMLTQSSQPHRKNPITALFKSVLRECGVHLTPSTDEQEKPNILTQEQALVIRSIEAALEQKEVDDAANQFLKGFKLLIKKEQYLKKSLMPTILKRSEDDTFNTNVRIEQESLFRIFLQIPILQNQVIEIILNEVTSHAVECDQDTAWLRLLLNQLRYLGRINDPKSLTIKLLDIMDVASFASQLEILDSIPEVVPDNEYNNTAKHLNTMLENEQLSGAIIDCLNALNLDMDIRTELQNQILSKISRCSTKGFPALLEFLMTDLKGPNTSSTLMKIRNALDNIMGSNGNTSDEKQSTKIVIFQRFQVLTCTKPMSEAWLIMLSNIKSHLEHKAMDVLSLFMLHSRAKFKKRAIETLFRKRVKAGLFKCSLLQDVFEKYIPQQLFRDYFFSCVEIGCTLLRTSTDINVTEYTSTLFQQLFNHQFSEAIYRQDIIDSLLLLTGTNHQSHISLVLRIFYTLLENTTSMQNHTTLMMRLLDKINVFELKDVKMIFEILCTLTCSSEILSGLKQDIHMIIRKHLSSAKRGAKQRGIVGAIVMAKHIAVSTEENEAASSDQSIVDLNQLGGAAYEAAKLLELVTASIAKQPELLALYYDQLGAMLSTNQLLDKNFLNYLFETVTSDFQSVAVVDSISEPIDGLSFEMQYNLNDENELDTPLAVNIAGLTLQPITLSILVLASHFRLLRLLHFRCHNGNLESIDALLGCSVILPKVSEELDLQQTRKVADCLFHAINWFREVTSAFVLQPNKNLRNKVVKRISNIIELEINLKNLLENIPEHKLPLCYFDTLSQPTKQTISPQKETKSTKRPKKKQKLNEDESILTNLPIKQTPRKSINLTFREMDIDIAKLLRYPLCTTESSCSAITLNMSQLNFLLEDFKWKLMLVTQRQPFGSSNLHEVNPETIMTDCVSILPNLNIHFIAISNKINEHEKRINNEEGVEIQHSFGLMLEILVLIFNWPGFQHSKRLDLLREVVKAFRPLTLSQNLNSVNRLVLELAERLSTCETYCLQLNHAVNLVKIMEALQLIIVSPEIQTLLAKTSLKFLSKAWPESTGKEFLINTDTLIKTYLKDTDLKSLCNLIATVEKEAQNLKSRGDNLIVLKSVNRANFHILYRSLWSATYDRIKNDIQAVTNSQHLVIWRTTALIMQELMMVAKAQETKINLICFLKKSIAILKIFLSHGIPILEIMLKSQPDQVLEIFKTMQASTRFLHHLCCFSKLNKDTALVSYVPQFRLTIETLVYRVKAALAANDCSDAFWMGNLKNKDLQGEDILSQSTVTTPENEEEEELPADDDEESDGDIFGTNNEDSNMYENSASEVYD